MDRGVSDPAVTLTNEGIVGGRRILSNRTRVKRRNRRSLKWGTINAQSLGNKMDLLDYRVNLHKLKIVSVTETWGHEKMGDAKFALRGYKMYRNDRIGKEGEEQFFTWRGK